MKRVVLSLALVAVLGLSFTSCRDTKEKTEDNSRTNFSFYLILFGVLSIVLLGLFAFISKKD